MDINESRVHRIRSRTERAVEQRLTCASFEVRRFARKPTSGASIGLCWRDEVELACRLAVRATSKAEEFFTAGAAGSALRRRCRIERDGDPNSHLRWAAMRHPGSYRRGVEPAPPYRGFACEVGLSSVSSDCRAPAPSAGGLPTASGSHWSNESNTGHSAWPQSVRAYSTLGGTCGWMTRRTKPAFSSCRSCCVSIFCDTPGIDRSSSEKRRTRPPKRLKRIKSFQRPLINTSASSTPRAAASGVGKRCDEDGRLCAARVAMLRGCDM